MQRPSVANCTLTHSHIHTHARHINCTNDTFALCPVIVDMMTAGHWTQSVVR